MLNLAQSFGSPKAAGLNGVIQFKLTGEQGGDWVMAIQGQQCAVEEGTAPKPNLTITARAQDFMDIVSGKKDGVRAFMQGKLRLSGDMGLAMKLQPLFLHH
jgi:putative sterol carrier protein